MFLLLNKPVVTFNNIAPKDYLINITEPDLLEQSIEHGLAKPKPLMDNIQHFIEQTLHIMMGALLSGFYRRLMRCYLARFRLKRKSR